MKNVFCLLYGDYLLTSFYSVANILYLRSIVAVIFYLRCSVANILKLWTNVNILNLRLRSNVANILYLRSVVANSLYCRGVVIVSELSDENKAACRLHH